MHLGNLEGKIQRILLGFPTTRITSIGNCDVVAPEETDMLAFTLENDSTLSRIKISGFQEQVLHTDDSEFGNIAQYIVNSSSACYRSSALSRIAVMILLLSTALIDMDFIARSGSR